MSEQRPSRSRPGRPSKFTEDRRRKILEGIGLGVPIEIACRYAGVDDSSFYRWMERGQRERAGGEYRAFVDAVTHAEAKCEVRAVAEWTKHFGKKYEACRDFLRGRFPERWGEKHQVRVAVEKEFEAMLADLRTRVSPDVFRQVIEGIASGRRGPSDDGDDSV